MAGLTPVLAPARSNLASRLGDITEHPHAGRVPASNFGVMIVADDSTLLLKVEQAAKLCQISRGLTYELIARGLLPHVRLGRVIRVPRLGLEAWIAREAGLPPTSPEGVDFPRQPDQRH